MVNIKKFFIIYILFSGFFGFSQRKDTLDIPKVELYKKNTKELIPAQVLFGKDLHNLNSHSVADALRYFSGVQIKDYGGIGGLKTINIRSMGSQHIGVFYDGIQLGNAQNGVVDLGKFSLDDVEEISLYNGQKSEIFQPAKDFGSSGSIYIQPKRPHFNGKDTNLVFRLKNSSIDLFNPSYRLEQKLSEKMSMSFSSEFLQSDGVYKFRYHKKYPNGKTAYDTIAKRQDSDIRAKRWELGVFGKGWDARGYAYESNRGIPAAIVNGRFGARGQRLNDRNYFIQTSFKKKIFPKLETQWKGKFAYDETKYTDTVSSIKIQNRYIQREVYLSSSALYSAAPHWDFSISTDFQWNNLDADLVNFSYPTRYTEMLAVATTFQKNRWKILASVLGTFVQEKVERNTKSPNKNEWTPSLFLSYQLWKEQDFTLRAFYKKSFRMPTFNDLYYTMIGTSNLKPEYTHQYNFGFTYQNRKNHRFFEEFYLKTDAYFNKVENKIIAAPNGSMFRWAMLNLGKVEILGIDANLHTKFRIKDLKIKPLLSFTYQKARDFSSRENNFYGHQIPYTPWHSGTFSVMTEYKSWGLHYSFVYVGERYDVNQNNIAYNYVQPWYTHDISVQKRFLWGKHEFGASLEINNLLNQYYDVVLNYPMPGRNFKLILNWKW